MGWVDWLGGLDGLHEIDGFDAEVGLVRYVRRVGSIKLVGWVTSMRYIG